MSTAAPCNCDSSLYWKRRALAAELSLAFARRQLEGVIAVMPVARTEEEKEQVWERAVKGVNT